MCEKGYKALHDDWTSMNAFKWEVGKTYKHDGKLKVCESGFHYYQKLANAIHMSRVSFDMKKYKVPGLDDLAVTNFVYDIEHTYIVEVEALGEIQKHLEVSATDEIRIVRELSAKEILTSTNTRLNNYGFDNTGNCNYGNRNPGYFNFGHQNVGSYNFGSKNIKNNNIGNNNLGSNNIGSGNTGLCNFGDFNGGICCKGDYIPMGSIFCTNNNEPFDAKREVRVFNKVMDAAEFQSALLILRNRYSIFDDAVVKRSNFPVFIISDLTPTAFVFFADMTDEEKKSHPGAELVGGYLFGYTYEGIWKEFWRSPLNDPKKNLIKDLPGFDPDIFKEITGIDV